MNKLLLPTEWYLALRKAGIKRAAVAEKLRISAIKLTNYYSRTVYCPPEIYKRIGDYVTALSAGQKFNDIVDIVDKSTFVGRVRKIKCVSCGEFFTPYDTELTPTCKWCTTQTQQSAT